MHTISTNQSFSKEIYRKLKAKTYLTTSVGQNFNRSHAVRKPKAHAAVREGLAGEVETCIVFLLLHHNAITTLTAGSHL